MTSSTWRPRPGYKGAFRTRLARLQGGPIPIRISLGQLNLGDTGEGFIDHVRGGGVILVQEAGAPVMALIPIDAYRDSEAAIERASESAMDATVRVLMAPDRADPVA